MIDLPHGQTTIPFDETNTTVLRSCIDELSNNLTGAELVKEAMA